MQAKHFINLDSLLFAIISFIGSFWIIYGYSSEFNSSVFASLLCAAFAWGAYVVVRWVILSLWE